MALLCGNGFIVGINQIYDVDIDAVNKPFLPMASGEMSAGVAWMVVAGLAGLGVGIVATNFGQLITALYTFGLVLGTIYRWVAFRFCTSPGKKAGASVLGHTDGICRAWAVIIRTLTRSIAQVDVSCLTSLPAPVRPCSPR